LQSKFQIPAEFPIFRIQNSKVLVSLVLVQIFLFKIP
jgi:hypothetical protein